MTNPSEEQKRAALEEWKPVVGYEGLYETSTIGRIRNLSGKIMSQCDHTHGYLQVSLRKEMKSKTHTVHSLVLSAFVDKPSESIVNHKDGIKKNNRLDNLEWVTYSGNLKHAMDTGLQKLNGEDNPFHTLTVNQVKEIRAAKGTPYRTLAKKYGVDAKTVWRASTGETWKNI